MIKCMLRVKDPSYYIVRGINADSFISGCLSTLSFVSPTTSFFLLTFQLQEGEMSLE